MQIAMPATETIDLDLNQLGLETKQRKLQSIQRAADEAFSQHILAKMETHWECFNKDSSFYSFKVAMMPGAILLWGDIGTMVIDSGEEYNLDWLTRHTDSMPYILSKISLVKSNYFYSGEFRSYILGNNNREVMSYLGDDWSEYSYLRYQMKYGDADIGDSVYGYNPAALWGYQALKKFVELLRTNNAIH